MTDLARKLFYVYDPQIVASKDSFRDSCKQSEQTIVLGCYVSNDKIYIYDVNDDRLAGVQEVTAAHEMLHAAYDRLSNKEKERLNALLDAAYSNVSNERIRKNVEQYRQRDPTVVANELHSILGSEAPNLDSELEKYYSQYFSDRSKVVALSQQYEAEFTAHEEQIAVYDTQLQTLKETIDAQESRLTQLEQQLTSKRSALDRSSQASVDAYNSLVSSYNSIVDSLRLKIEEYNTLVAIRNKEAETWQSLVDAIDTRAETL
jgi:DNA repair exonuclease SbcCD ATPase subunit